MDEKEGGSGRPETSIIVNNSTLLRFQASSLSLQVGASIPEILLPRLDDLKNSHEEVHTGRGNIDPFSPSSSLFCSMLPSSKIEIFHPIGINMHWLTVEFPDGYVDRNRLDFDHRLSKFSMQRGRIKIDSIYFRFVAFLFEIVAESIVTI